MATAVIRPAVESAVVPAAPRDRLLTRAEIEEEARSWLTQRGKYNATTHRNKIDQLIMQKTFFDDDQTPLPGAPLHLTPRTVAADTIVVGSDPVPPLNPAALDEAVAPEEARRSIEKPEWHYPPKHGSWLERAESALRVLQRQGLDSRIPDPQT